MPDETDGHETQFEGLASPVPYATSSGAIAQGNLSLHGTYVAGRDIHVHRAAANNGESRPIPAQLPLDAPDFTDREDELNRLLGILEPASNEGTNVPLITIAGQAGAGKTALAVRAAHLLKECFPAGQFFIEMRSQDNSPRDPTEILGSILRELGVGAAAVPRDLTARSALYRSRLARGRYLIVLDDAAREEQARPLLPGASGSAVIITSRMPLYGLPTGTAVRLAMLSPDDAVSLLGKLVGRNRVDCELGACFKLAELCGGLPLAVKIVGAKLAGRPHWSIARYQGKLSIEVSRLNELSAGDIEIRASLELSYVQLPHTLQAAFCKLGILPRGSFPLWAAALALDLQISEAEDVLDPLVDNNLLNAEQSGATQEVVYRMHDLVRLYAIERLKATSEDEQAGAGTRVICGAIEYASLYDDLLGQSDRNSLEAVPEASTIDPLDRISRAASWFDSNWEFLGSISRLAYQRSEWVATCALVDRIAPYLRMRGLWDEWGILSDLAIHGAVNSASPDEQAWARRARSDLLRHRADWAGAAVQVAIANKLFVEANDKHGLGWATYTRAEIAWHRGTYRGAVNDLDLARALFEECGDTRGAAWCEKLIADTAREQRQTAKASASYQRSVELFEMVGDRHGQAWAYLGQGTAARYDGDLRFAVDLYLKAIEIFSKLANRESLAWAEQSLGVAYHRLGEHIEATAYYNSSLNSFEMLADGRGRNWTLHALSALRLARGDLNEAQQGFEDCHDFFAGLGEQFGESKSLLGLAMVHRQRHNLVEESALLLKAQDLARSIGVQDAIDETWLVR